MIVKAWASLAQHALTACDLNVEPSSIGQEMLTNDTSGCGNDFDMGVPPARALDCHAGSKVSARLCALSFRPGTGLPVVMSTPR